MGKQKSFSMFKLKFFILTAILLLTSLTSCSYEPKTNEHSKSEKTEIKTDTKIINTRKVLEPKVKAMSKQFKQFSIANWQYGHFNKDEKLDLFVILFPQSKDRLTSKCILIFGNDKENLEDSIVFDDLLPNYIFSGKIDSPYDSIRISENSLFVRFRSSAYGQNISQSDEYTFQFNPTLKTFDLFQYAHEICVLPDCENLARIDLVANELKCCTKSFSYTSWLDLSGGSENYVVGSNNIDKFKKYALQLQKLGNECSLEAELMLNLVSSY